MWGGRPTLARHTAPHRDLAVHTTQATRQPPAAAVHSRLSRARLSGLGRESARRRALPLESCDNVQNVHTQSRKISLPECAHSADCRERSAQAT